MFTGPGSKTDADGGDLRGPPLPEIDGWIDR